MALIEFDSTTLAWAAYSPDQRLLELGFRTGKVYDYFDVPPESYRELIQADSKGRNFNLHIRNHFRFELVHARALSSQN